MFSSPHTSKSIQHTARSIRCAAHYLLLSMILGLFSCKSGSLSLFKPASLHEQYQKKLIAAGLDKTAMGAAWINAAGSSMENAIRIDIPYKETGYFSVEKATAVSYIFNAVRGQKLTLSLDKNPGGQFMIYADLWMAEDRANPKLLASMDSLGRPVELEVTKSTAYMIRLQPELLRSGNYTVEISTGPSLDFPVRTGTRKKIDSFWGDSRDDNTRKHEGVDIFAARGTPAIAATTGTVVRVNENNLGGRVVWMRPAGKDYTLYYAHLDRQIATEGQNVKTGDTLGLIGDTGNARTTGTHLHFGIYATGGAINPLPFINPAVPPLPDITASKALISSTARTTGTAIMYPLPDQHATQQITLAQNQVVQVNGAAKDWYRITLPDGKTGFIKGRSIKKVAPIRSITIKNDQQELYEGPDNRSPVKTYLSSGMKVSLLGEYRNYQLVSNEGQQTGWISK